MQSKFKKTICFVVSDPLTVNVFLQNHIKHLSTNFDIHIVANLKQGEIIDTKLINSVKHINLCRKIKPIIDIMALINLYFYFNKMHFDAVHTFTPKAGLLGIIASKMAKIPHRTHIFTGQVWHTKTGLLKYFFKSIDILIVKLASNILVDGQSQHHYLIKEKVVSLSNSQVLGNGSISGALPSKFYKKENTRLILREKYLISESDIVFAFLGRMNKDKGVFDLIEAFHVLNCQYKNTKLLMIGPDEELIRSKIKESISKNIIWLGQTNSPENYLQMADVFCLPSHREGFGTSVIEASLIGLPVICSDTYGLKDSFLENTTGLSHLTGNPISLFEKMKTILLNEDLRLILGKNAREYVLSKFDADEISKHWLGYYTHIFHWNHNHNKLFFSTHELKINSFSYYWNK